MGNANGAHRLSSARGDFTNSASRNPLQRGFDAPPTAAPAPRHVQTGSTNASSTDANITNCKTNNSNNKRHIDDDRGNFLVPPPPPLMMAGLGNNNAADSNARARRAPVTISSDEDPPHQPPQRFPGSRGFSIEDVFDSNSGSFVSQASSLNAKPRLTLGEAREILLPIFFPRQGQLECIASGFLTAEQYALMHGFWAPFLNTVMRDKWYLDAVMLSVLGKDRWRSSRLQNEIITSVSPSREQVLQLNQQRQDYSDQLRERLLDLCGSLIESQEHHAKKGNLQSLLEEYNRHKETHPNGVPGRNSAGSGDNVKRGLSRTSSEAASTMQQQELLSLALIRLQTTVSTSFDCFDLLASRIPTSVISSLPSNYFLNSTPVVYEPIAYQEKKIGDLDRISFFMSIESRRRLLIGKTADETEHLAGASFNEVDFALSFSTYGNTPVESTISSAQKFYSAVRHAGLVATTACSSMVLTVMFQLAEVLRARQVFCDNRAKAAQNGITLEQLIGRKEAVIRTYTGKHTDDLEELKRYAITGEMSLAVLTRLLVDRFRKENRAKMEKLRKRYPNIFAYLEAIAPPEEQEDFDATRLLSGMVLKLMYLTGGGQRSIVADDRRVPCGVSQVTDDVAISNMLEMPILNRICWVACMMGMPIMSNHGILAQKHQGKPLTYIELDECCGVMRVLFQAVGALPCGSACPQAFKEWFPLFPFYAVNAEGKRVLMYLYAAQVSAIQRVPLTIQKDMTLLSFSTALQAAKGKGRTDTANYFFDPTLTVGYTGKDKDSECSSMSMPLVPSLTARKAAGPAPPLAPKAIADAIGATVGCRTADADRVDRTSPLAMSASGDDPAAAKAMPASLNNNSSASPLIDENFQYMTPVNIVSSAGKTASKMFPSRSIPQQTNDNTNSDPVKGQQQQQQQTSALMDDNFSAFSSSTSLSCSTLMEDNRDIDVYTCVSPQAQLYMRCSHEATLRRHRATELTPSVAVWYLHSQHEVQSKRPDIAPALHRAVPKLMPSEGFLVVRWTSAEPLVTFCAGDIVSAMAERTSSAPASGNAGGGNTNNNNNTIALSPTRNAQNRSSGTRYFTGATRPSLENGFAATGDGGKGVSTTASINPDDNSARTLSPARRMHTVTIDDAMLQDSTLRAVGLSLSDRTAGISSSDRTCSSNNNNSNNNNYDLAFTGYGSIEEEASSSSTSRINASEQTRMYQGLLHEFLGVEEKLSRRLAVRWSVIEVLPSIQLVHRSSRWSANANASGAKHQHSQDPQQQQQYRNEVVLHVAALEMPVSLPLKVLTIGHERASMSVFTFISPDNDSVCWANPRLIEALMNRETKSSSHGTSTTEHPSCIFLQGGDGAPKGPRGVLCNTEEELHNVFFSIGVLLSNAIVNGVYFTAPIAPLAFLLMKKAISSGDYSFKSFMWLEPADGNLLSPALVLNAAYEILTMTEHQYLAFLKSRGIASDNAHVFPVMHSLLDEMKEDNMWSSMSTPPGLDGSRRSQSHVSGERLGHTRDSGDISFFAASSTTRDRSLNASSSPSNMHEYMKLIQHHNRRGSAFRRSQPSFSETVDNNSGSAGIGALPSLMISGSVSVQNRLQGYRNQQQQQQQQQKSNGRSRTASASSLEALYAKLPSRREYLFLYLVNDLAWGSVRRDDIGEKNKELWVSMARGFMSSAVAKSPLMTNCCSRIIREVLCVPRSDG